jgi:type IV secretory pathway TrbD component
MPAYLPVITADPKLPLLFIKPLETVMALADLHLPHRPVAVRKDAVSMPRGYLFTTLTMLAIAAFLVAWQGPDLLQDVEISKNPVALEDADIQNGRCTTRKGVFTDCEARLVYALEGRQYEKNVHLFFVDFHVGDYETGVVVSGDHPEMATLGLGIEKLPNRIISFGVLVLLVAGLGVGMLFLGLRVLRVRRQLGTAATLVPIPVEITAFNRNRRGLFVTYADKLAEGKTKRSGYTHFIRGEEPLILGMANNKAVGAAVRHGSTSLPVLLDNRLERIDLTEDERRAALAPVEAALQPGGGMIVLQEEKRKPKILRGILTAVILILVIFGAVLGYWLWYVTSAPSQFNQVGMEINNILPRSMNSWGCDQLQARFGHDRAPFGCTASDYTSWK